VATSGSDFQNTPRRFLAPQICKVGSVMRRRQQSGLWRRQMLHPAKMIEKGHQIGRGND
jgi:hypothetical protein